MRIHTLFVKEREQLPLPRTAAHPPQLCRARRSAWSGALRKPAVAPCTGQWDAAAWQPSSPTVQRGPQRLCLTGAPRTECNKRWAAQVKKMGDFLDALKKAGQLRTDFGAQQPLSPPSPFPPRTPQQV